MLLTTKTSVCTLRRDDPQPLNKTNIDCAFRAWQHQSNFKKTIVGLFSIFHLGNYTFTIDVTQTSSHLTVKLMHALYSPVVIPGITSMLG
jgi:hypothetical protein